MKVLILSDFSPVAINATLYALDLLREQQVDFTLLNIYEPDDDAEEEEKERKRNAVKAKLEERVQKLRERSVGRPHVITGYYSEEKLLNATRHFMERHQVDLLVMGAVGEELRHDTILGNHTFEIMSKIKCNLLAVPDKKQKDGLQNLLMPLDLSASFKRKNLQFLNEQSIFHRTRLSVWEITNSSEIHPKDNAGAQHIFEALNEIEVDFSSIDKSAVSQEEVWNDVQERFDWIVLMGKNIGICRDLMHNRHGLFTSMPNRLPILVLHD